MRLLVYFPTCPITSGMRAKRGFSLLARMPTGRLADLAGVAKKSIGVKYPPFEKYASDLEVSPEDVMALLSAAGLASAILLSARVTSAEEFARIAVEEELAEEEHRAAISKFAQIVLDQAGPWRDSLDRSRIASQIIPAFALLNTTIDVRLQIEEGQVQAAVPVAILYLGTDVDEEEIIFQATKKEIEYILEQLQDLKDQLQTTEEWIAPRSPRKGE